MLILLARASRGGDEAAMSRFEAQRRAVDELIYEEIARRREVSDLEERDDVFSLLLLARDEDGEALSDAEVRDELVTLLVAGPRDDRRSAWPGRSTCCSTTRTFSRARARAATSTSTRWSRRPCASSR